MKIENRMLMHTNYTCLNMDFFFITNSAYDIVLIAVSKSSLYELWNFLSLRHN